MHQGALVLSYLYCQFEQLNFYYYKQIRETGIHVFCSLTYNRSNLKTGFWVVGVVIVMRYQFSDIQLIGKITYNKNNRTESGF